MAGEGIGWNQNGWDTPFFRSNMTERSKPFAEEGQAKKGKKEKLSTITGRRMLEPKAITGESCQRISAAAGRSSAAAQLVCFLVTALSENSIELGKSGTAHRMII